MRNTIIKLRLETRRRDLLDHAAHLLGKDRSDFILEAACEKAQAIMLDQILFDLDKASYREFVNVLDAAPSRNAGLGRLMAIERPWDR